MIAARTDDLARAGRLAGLIALTTATLAAGVRIVGPAQVRDELRYVFVGIPAQVEEMASILLNNLAVLGVAVAAAVVAQLQVRTHARGLRPLVWACDAVLVLECAQHVVLVGSAIGAYGRTGLAAVLPHGPVELAGFSVGLSLYLSSRRERLAWGRGLTLVAIAAATLGVAAVMEVFG
jgi:hypothetical protein